MESQGELTCWSPLRFKQFGIPTVYVLYQLTNDSMRDLTEPIQSTNQLNFFHMSPCTAEWKKGYIASGQ